MKYSVKGKGKRLLLPILSLATLLIVTAIFIYVAYMQNDTVEISHESGIYHESIELSVKTMKPATVLYTVNGEKPAEGDEDTLVYDEPLVLSLEKDASTYSFQFQCLYKDGTLSEVHKRDFILEKETDRYSTTYVVSVTGDEDALFGYEEGVFVRGRQFDEYMEENPDVDTLSTIIPANYFSDVEIPVHMAIFNQEGTPIFGQNCGLKIYGNITRAKNQKSFRLIARYDYDSVNEFSYAFLPGLVSDKTHTVIDEFQRLSFHNTGNDHGYGFVRTELIGELAKRLGFPDVLVSESATVYINGRYQGVYWLQNTFDDRYFQEKYGEYLGEMVVCEGELDWMSEEAAEDIYEQSYTVHYNDFSLWVREADMQDDANWKRVCDTIDVNNFAQYMAIEYYINNMDWPQNNVKVYRYVNDNGDYQENTVFDGKYRYLLFDTDYGMGLKFQGWFGADAQGRRLGELSEYYPLFACLLEREEFRNSFVNALLCLMNGSFSVDEVSEVLKELNEKQEKELQYMMEETTLLKNSLWESDDNSMENVRQEWQEILDFVQQRPQTVIEELNEKWDCGETRSVKFTRTDVGEIIIGGQTVGEEFDGYWLENIPMEISFETSPGVIVEGYKVNSTYMEGTTISIIPGEWTQTLVIEPVLKYSDEESIQITSYDIDGTEDYIVLENNGRSAVLLSQYYISDTEDEPYKGKLPAVTLQPGESFVIYGSKYLIEENTSEKNYLQVSFSWNVEEKVILSHKVNGIVDVKTR